MTGRVAVVGSLNADLTVRTARLPRPGQTVTGSDVLLSPGGKGANQAVAAAKVGAAVAMVGRVGDDEHGRLLVGRLRDAGVDTTGVEALAGVPTGTAFIAVDEQAENFIILAPGANARLSPVDVAAARTAIEGADVLCLCLEVDLAAVIAAARVASKAGTRVVLNLSPSRQIGGELLSRVDILVVNRHELADLVGADLVGDADEPDWAAVAAALRGGGPGHLVITLGAAGAVVLAPATHPAEPVRVPAPQVQAVDTTGCGDAFLGSLCARLAEGDDLPTAVRLAVRVGSYAATGRGAQDSYPTLTELQGRGR